MSVKSFAGPTPRNSPRPIPLSETVAAVKCGVDGTLFLTTSGRLLACGRCMGEGGVGEGLISHLNGSACSYVFL